MPDQKGQTLRISRAGRIRDAAARAELAGEASAEAAYQAEHADQDGDEAVSVLPGADLTAAAFFDVDNTMMQGASVFHFARGLAARKFFTNGDLMRFAMRQVKFRVGGEDLKDASDAREEALSFVAGRSVAQIVALGEDIYDELMADKIYPGTRELAQRHLDGSTIQSTMRKAAIKVRRCGAQNFFYLDVRISGEQRICGRQQIIGEEARYRAFLCGRNIRDFDPKVD